MAHWNYTLETPGSCPTPDPHYIDSDMFRNS